MFGPVVICILQLWSVYGVPVGTGLTGSGNSMPRLDKLEVKCGRTGMSVHITFDKIFPGVIYSKGNFYDPKCNYVQTGHTNDTSYSFHIPLDSCGTSGELREPSPERDKYFENTIIIQNDPLIQEVWDVAKRLRCNWKHSIRKSVKTSPLSVEDPEKVSVKFDSRSVNTLMQVQRGRAPFSSPATGYIYKGEESSIVIYVQDDSGKLDANVVSCQAKSSSGERVSLVDSYGCVLRPDLLSPFTKMRQPNGIEADLMFYSYLDGFRVGDNLDFEISCQLEICEGTCLDPCALKEHRVRRGVSSGDPFKQNVEIRRRVIVVTKHLESDNYSGCSLATPVAVTVSCLVFITAVLSLVTCLLIFKIYHLKNGKS